MATVDNETGKFILTAEQARFLRAGDSRAFVEQECIVVQPWQGRLFWPIRWNGTSKLFENAVPR